MSSRLIDAATLGPQRRRRRMAKLLAQLDQLDRDSALRLPPREAKPKTHRLGSLLVVLLLLIGGAGIFFAARRHTGHRPSANATHAAAVGNDATALTENVQHLNGHVPTPGVGEQKTRLLPTPKPPAGSGGYGLLNAKYGPPRYDPCRPIHYVIRDQGDPPGGDADIRQAIAQVSKATGLKFVADGTTTETPTPKRAPYQPTRYGDRWAPLLIAWTDPTHMPFLAGPIAGRGGSQPYALGPGPSTYVTGALFLDAPQLTQLQAGPEGNVAVLTTIEHELGHVVGLDHVKDPTQIMYPEGHGQTHFGAGDLRGLAYEGSGACHPEL
jgi:hypothetical protein